MDNVHVHIFILLQLMHHSGSVVLAHLTIMALISIVFRKIGVFKFLEVPFSPGLS